MLQQLSRKIFAEIQIHGMFWHRGGHFVSFGIHIEDNIARFNGQWTSPWKQLLTFFFFYKTLTFNKESLIVVWKFNNTHISGWKYIKKQMSGWKFNKESLMSGRIFNTENMSGWEFHKKRMSGWEFNKETWMAAQLRQSKKVSVWKDFVESSHSSPTLNFTS